MAVKVKSRRGNVVTLLNPSEKGHKAAVELKDGYKMTNDGKYKVDKYGDPIPLNDTERAYRAGYLTAQKDSAKCYKARQKKKAANRKK